MRRIAKRLAAQVITVGRFSKDCVRQFRLHGQHAVVMHQADGVNVHLVFSGTKKVYVQREAEKLRKLLVDFAMESLHRQADANDRSGQYRRPANERRWRKEPARRSPR